MEAFAECGSVLVLMPPGMAGKPQLMTQLVAAHKQAGANLVLRHPPRLNSPTPSPPPPSTVGVPFLVHFVHDACS